MTYGKDGKDGNLLAESLERACPLCPLVKKKLKIFKITLDKLIHMCYNTNCNIGNTLLMFGEQYE